MLKIIICEKDKTSANAMHSTLAGIIRGARYDARIELTTIRPEDALAAREKIADVSMLILEAVYSASEMTGAELGLLLRRKYLSDYLVFSTERAEYLQTLLRGNIFPAAILIKPFEAEELAEIMGNIYTDYTTRGWAPDFVSFSIGVDIYRLPSDKVLYFESLEKKIYIHTRNQRFGYYDSLNDIERRYDALFVRCHKSYLVNKKKIMSVQFSKMTITLDTGIEIPISRTYRPNIKEF